MLSQFRLASPKKLSHGTSRLPLNHAEELAYKHLLENSTPASDESEVLCDIDALETSGSMLKSLQPESTNNSTSNSEVITSSTEVKKTNIKTTENHRKNNSLQSESTNNLTSNSELVTSNAEIKETNVKPTKKRRKSNSLQSESTNNSTSNSELATSNAEIKKTNVKPAKKRRKNPSPESKDTVSKKKKKLDIQVKKTYEIHGSENDKVPTYLTKSSNKRGSVLLINNIKFLKDKRRDGADVDHENIKSLFENMGFAVQHHKDKNVGEMETIIEDYTKDPSLNNYDINVTIIMSHGGKTSDTMISAIDGHQISVEWIVEKFSNSNCKYLSEKPKIFIFQCCRGRKEQEQTDNIPLTTKAKKRSISDVLLAYATVPGYVSYRIKAGSRYIRAICDVFMENAHDTSVEDLLKMVDNNVNDYTQTRSMQTCSYENRGFKRCFFNPI